MRTTTSLPEGPRMREGSTDILDVIGTGDRIADRLAIHDCLHLNVAATDLLDSGMWKSTYWPDGEEDHGWYVGNAHRFIDETLVSLQDSMDTCWHQLSNVIIAFDDDCARVLTYFYAYCRMIAKDGTRWDSFSGGRYIDRFEKRSNHWKIKRRITKPDWVRSEPDSFAWGTEVIPGFVPKLGTRDPNDPGRMILREAQAAALSSPAGQTGSP